MSGEDYKVKQNPPIYGGHLGCNTMKISAVIPMYNSEATIISTLDSVLSQTYRGEIEVIVVNDGSTDQSEKVVKNYIKNSTSNNVVIRLISKTNGGVSSARNIGIKEAAGEWIGLLDSDDTWLPLKLEMQLKVINRNENIKFIGCNRNGEIYPYFNKSKQKVFRLTAKQLLFKWYPQTSTVLVSSQLLTQTLFDESKTHGEDGDLWLRIAKNNYLYILNQDLVYTGGGKKHFGESGLSADLSKMFSGELFNLKGALKRKQISMLEYFFFYFFFYFKYYRRLVISKVR